MGSACCGQPRQVQKQEIVPLKQISKYLQPSFFIYLIQDRLLQESLRLQIQAQYPQIHIFANRQELQTFAEDTKNNILLICCANKNQLRSTIRSKHSFSSIAFSCKDLQVNKPQEKLLKQLHGWRLKSLFRHNLENIIKYFKDSRQNNVFYTCKDDYAMINRRLLTLNFFCQNKNNIYRKKLFLEYVKQCEGGSIFLKENKNIFDESFMKIGQFFVDVLVGDIQLRGFIQGRKILKNVIQLIGKTTNPCILPHIAWFAQIMFKYIQTTHQNNKKQLRSLAKGYYLLIPNDFIQMEKLTQKDNLMFASFVIGYVSQNQARIAKGRSNSVIVHINVSQSIQLREIQRQKSPNYKKVQFFQEKLYDFGFVVKNNKVLFNLMNFYQVNEIKIVSNQMNSQNNKNWEIQMQYGSLAKQMFLQREDFRHYENCKRQQVYNYLFLFIYDIYLYYRNFVKNQLELIFFLQIYQKFKKTKLQIQQKTKKQAAKQTLAKKQNKYIDSQLFFKDQGMMGECLSKLGYDIIAKEYYLKQKPVTKGLLRLLYSYEQKINQLKLISDSSQNQRFTQLKNKYSQTVTTMVQCRGNFHNDKVLQKAYERAKAIKQRASQKVIAKCLEELRTFFQNQFVKKNPLQYDNQCINSWPLFQLLTKDTQRAGVNGGSLISGYSGSSLSNNPRSAESSIETRGKKAFKIQDPMTYFEGIHFLWLP